jgi:hypothetical protein
MAAITVTSTSNTGSFVPLEHKKPENARRYFKPSPEAIAELTSLLLAPGDSRR